MVSPADILHAKILIVDDQEANVLLLEQMLRAAGYDRVSSTQDPTTVCELHLVEHFDLIHEALGYNAQIIFGIDEEVIVARPSVFGPFPAAIKSVVDRTIKYRLMAHSAEDITGWVLQEEWNYRIPMHHSDVKHGFVISFAQPPDIDLEALEAKVKDIIARDVPIAPAGENRIAIGDHQIPCTGTRTHVKRSGQIEGFRLLKDFRYHPLLREYMLVGTVGSNEPSGYEEISRVPEL